MRPMFPSFEAICSGDAATGNVEPRDADVTLNQAHNPPRETSDVTLIDGGCGVPIIVTTDPGISEDSTMPSIRLEGVCGSLTGSRRGHWRTLPLKSSVRLVEKNGGRSSSYKKYQV